MNLNEEVLKNLEEMNKLLDTFSNEIKETEKMLATCPIEFDIQVYELHEDARLGWEKFDEDNKKKRLYLTLNDVKKPLIEWDYETRFYSIDALKRLKNTIILEIQEKIKQYNQKEPAL